MQVHDLIGIGFGPSNVALAIALEEQSIGGQKLSTVFLEKQPTFSWHPDMLLENAHMQISFLKDLATMRNPSSRFTFINYLHEKGRLQDFINLKTFFPSRHEFHDYLAWAASHFEDRCAYGEEVVDIMPEMRDGQVSLLRVRSRTRDGESRERLGRNLVVGVGGTPNIPDAFAALRGNPRVFHSSQYLRSITAHTDPQRIAIIGAGQSSAELFMDLHGRFPSTRIDLIMRGHTIRPSDNSPFVNEVFNAEFVDHIYHRPGHERENMLRSYWHANYAAPDLEIIETIFNVCYEQRVRGEERHRILRRHEVRGAQDLGNGIVLDLQDLDAGAATQATQYDLVVLGTGYERRHHRDLLASLAPWVGDLVVDRNYRVSAPAEFKPGIYLQGACESSHGLSDTLLSVTAVRTGEITAALRPTPADAPPSLPLGHHGNRHSAAYAARA